MIRIKSNDEGVMLSPLWIVAAFILLIGPFALDFHMHYPDEMYYSDAAVRMVQDGDYLTTYLGSGELRFKKPILTYWAVLTGFKLFGISAFSSRLFFLLAGAFTVWLACRIGRLTFSDRKIAYLSALIAASHPVLIFSSTRSIPDILLALCITLAALGFAGVLKYGNDSPKKYWWLLYLGLGLAFEVKGLPALAFGGIGLMYLLLNPWQRIKLKTLLYFPAIFVGLAIAVFWFVSMYLKYGSTYLESFYSDQVGVRVTDQLVTMIKNFFFAVILMVFMYVPWAFFGFKNIGKNIKAMVRENPAFFWWMVVWIISVILMSTAVTKFYERYLLPVVPLGAVGLGWLLSKNPILEKSKPMTLVLYLFFGLNMVVLMAALFLNVGMGASWYIYAGLILGIGILWKMLENLRKIQHSYFWLAASILLLFYFGSFITYQISLPHQGRQVAQVVRQANIPEGSRIAFIGHLHTGSKIRISLGENYFMTDLQKENYREVVEQYDYVICDEDIKEELNPEEFQIQTASLNWDPKLLGGMVGGILNGNFDVVLQEEGKRYYWAERK